MKKLTLLVDIPRVQEFTCMQGWMNQFGKNLSNIWNFIPFCLIRTLWRKEIGTLLKIRKARDSVVNQQFYYFIISVVFIHGILRIVIPCLFVDYYFNLKKKKNYSYLSTKKNSSHARTDAPEKRKNIDLTQIFFHFRETTN